MSDPFFPGRVCANTATGLSDLLNELRVELNTALWRAEDRLRSYVAEQVIPLVPARPSGPADN